MPVIVVAKKGSQTKYRFVQVFMKLTTKVSIDMSRFLLSEGMKSRRKKKMLQVKEINYISHSLLMEGSLAA